MNENYMLETAKSRALKAWRVTVEKIGRRDAQEMLAGDMAMKLWISRHFWGPYMIQLDEWLAADGWDQFWAITEAQIGGD